MGEEKGIETSQRFWHPFWLSCLSAMLLLQLAASVNSHKATFCVTTSPPGKLYRDWLWKSYYMDTCILHYLGVLGGGLLTWLAGCT